MASKKTDSNATHFDLISRGNYRQSLPGTLTYVGLRAVSPILQYGILAHGLGSNVIHSLGLATLQPGLPAATGIRLIDGLQLSPYRLILLGMSTGAAVKHIFWKLAISREAMGPPAAAGINLYHMLRDSINDLLFTVALTSASLNSEASFPQYPLLIGTGLYVAGLLTETLSEVQRAKFKANPNNHGQPCTGGLWSVARHINYTGYTLWRTGYALAAGGWIWGGVTAALIVADFTQRGIPVLDKYCSYRYAAKWQRFKEQTPYELIPYVW